MRIAVFGATGGTGLQIIQQALDKEIEITALVRNLAKMSIDDASLRIINGDVLDPAKVRETVQGADAVVCSLGSTSSNPDTMLRDGTSNIIAAMKEEGIQRLIVVSSMGVGDSMEQLNMVMRTMFKTVLKSALQQKALQEAVVADSGLDWVIVRPGGLTDGPYTGEYSAGTDRSIKAKQVSRADVADFVLQQIESDTNLHQYPVVT